MFTYLILSIIIVCNETQNNFYCQQFVTLKNFICCEILKLNKYYIDILFVKAFFKYSLVKIN